MEIQKCPDCGARIEESKNGFKFCPYCGAKMPEKKIQPTIQNNVTVIQTLERQNTVDKFLDHRKSIRTLKTERALAKEEQRAAIERERLIKEQEEQRAHQEVQKRYAAEEEKKKKLWSTAIFMSPILIPLIIIAAIVAFVIASKLGVVDYVKRFFLD